MTEATGNPSGADAEPSMDPTQWVRTLATALGTARPSQDEIDDLLSLAGTAAHTAERWVAPVSCWLVARAGVDAREGRAVVERLAAAARGGTAGDESAE